MTKQQKKDLLVAKMFELINLIDDYITDPSDSIEEIRKLNLIVFELGMKIKEG
jgi:hypothetical protein